MNQQALDYFLSHQESRQLWHYTERIPCDVLKIQRDGHPVNFVVNHPSGENRVLPSHSAEIVPQVGDDCLLVASELVRYWGRTTKKPPDVDWSKLRRIYSIDGGQAKGLGSPLVIAPLRCFAFFSADDMECVG